MKDNSLRKKDKILRRYEYKEIYSKGKKISVDGLFLIYILKRGNGCPRMGITVTKKVGGAVVRNRIKRIFREIFRLNRGSIIEGIDIVIVARKGLEKVRYMVIEESFLKALESVKAYSIDEQLITAETQKHRE